MGGKVVHCNFNLSRNSVDYDFFHASKQALNNLEVVQFGKHF